jgi:hypothetical protein
MNHTTTVAQARATKHRTVQAGLWGAETLVDVAAADLVRRCRSPATTARPSSPARWPTRGLHGLLAKICDLGLELTLVHRTDPDSQPRVEGPRCRRLLPTTP